MLNIDAFIDRLEQLMENHQLNAASFSEKIGVNALPSPIFYQDATNQV